MGSAEGGAGRVAATSREATGGAIIPFPEDQVSLLAHTRRVNDPLTHSKVLLNSKILFQRI